MSRNLDKWFCFDENQNYVLREDAPEKIKEAYAMLLKKYPTVFEDETIFLTAGGFSCV